MTNILRSNEYLSKIDEKKTAIISAYEEYTSRLEQIVESLLSIQSDLRDIVRTEASLLNTQKKQARKPTRPAKKAKKSGSKK